MQSLLRQIYDLTQYRIQADSEISYLRQQVAALNRQLDQSSPMLTAYSTTRSPQSLQEQLRPAVATAAAAVTAVAQATPQPGNI